MARPVVARSGIKIITTPARSGPQIRRQGEEISMQTTADIHRDSAIAHVKSALGDLASILIDECHGHDKYVPEYLDDLENAFAHLQKAKRCLAVN